jgi:hypothetical protein
MKDIEEDKDARAKDRDNEIMKEKEAREIENTE